MKKYIFLLLCVCAVVLSGRAQTNDPSTAFQRYMSSNDGAYKWTVRDSLSYLGIKAYFFEFTSQKWQGMEWKHELAIIIPNNIKSDGALLWVTGGQVDDKGMPVFRKKTDGENVAMAQVAMENGTVTAVLRQVPNQPLFDNLSEGELMVYSLKKYTETKDDTWPVLFPMVKSASKAMDLIQEFTKKRRNEKISRFVVSGGSKRGWVSWMMGAAKDQRVVAIAPLVIDMLNMPVQLDHQAKVYGDTRNEEVKAYTEMGISAKKPSPQGEAIARMVDPYAYRQDITVPKLIVMAGNDNFWPIDAFRFYEKGLVGDYRLVYVPNVQHNLGDKKMALKTLNAFFKTTLDKKPYPECKWNMTVKNKQAVLNVTTTAKELKEAVLWIADSDKQDFRESVWKSTKVSTKDKANLEASVELPASGYRAFFVELKYPNSCSFTTRAYVVDSKGEKLD